MPKYRYTENTGVLAFYVDNKRYEIGFHPKLKMTIELPRKLNEDELKAIGIELVEESKKTKKTKGED